MLRSINKFIYPITLLIFALTLSACGGGGSGGGSSTPVNPPPPPTKADLSDLTLSAGSLNQPFQADVENYTTTVGLPVSSITVIPTTVETNATVTVNGTDVVSGATSPAIALAEGSNTITVVVTHPDTVKTYTIVTTRLSATAFVEQARKTGSSSAGKFGKQVAIDGNTLAVGAPTSNGSAGLVYIFVNDGSGAWTLEQELQASNAEANDQFGNSVSLAGNTLIVGAPTEQSSATGLNGDSTNNDTVGAGAAYIFTRSGTVWSEQSYLKASNTRINSLFGSQVLVSGDTAIVSATGEKNTGEDGDQFGNLVANSGAAYVFNRNSGIWSQTAYIKPSTIEDSKFGRSLALSGDTLAVSAHLENQSASIKNTGAVYIFTRSGTTWSEQTRVTASNAEAEDQFGISLDLDGNTLAVGAFLEDSVAAGVDADQTDNSANAAGAVYVFTGSGPSWTQQAYLKSLNPETDGQFGISVAVAGDDLAVGAQGEQASAGNVHFYTRSGTTWAQQSSVKPSVIAAGNKFGNSVSLLSDGKLAVGAENEGGSGAVYIMQK